MKILGIIILIIWSVARAVRKAQREQQQRRLTMSDAKGAVLSPDRSAIVESRDSQRSSDRIRSIEPQQTPEEDESIVELIQPIDGPDMEAYNQTGIVATTGISFDKRSLKTFFVTREILGPPRFRSPFRPSIRK
ncbi:MAG TPA: hypothetical protein VG537_01825 [Candidatus Kapabacteria bacterium]|jgi:hypothetical protein|nr:hypothetical protein [Candidatus Kapabacteria bacterium]